jgi:FkbM family methyltransferase
VSSPTRLLVKRLFARAGLDVRFLKSVEAARRKDKADSWRRAWSCVAGRTVATVVDIGANTGQFSRLASELWPGARILAFEPLPECFAELQAFLDGVPGARAFEVAAGSEEGRATIHRSAFSPSSSLLAMGERHKELWPHTAAHEGVEVKVRRVDDVLADVELRPEVLVKIDVQGFERHVIAGAMGTLCAAAVVVVEVAFEPLYDGQASFDAVYTSLRGLGLEFRGFVEQVVDPGSGRAVYADALFERRRPAPE